MPRGDGTGPMGMGALSGRAAGFCAGYGMPGFANGAPGCGRGRGGRGSGGGFGRRNRFYATGLPGWMRADEPAAAPSREQQAQALKRQAEALEASLGRIKERLAEMEKVSAGE